MVVVTDILKKLDFSTMAVANLHIRKKIDILVVPNSDYHNH